MNPTNRHPQGDAHTKEYVTFIRQLLHIQCEYHTGNVACKMLPKYFVISSTYLLTPWCRVLLEKLTGLQLVKKFPAFHGTRRFITALTSVRQLSLSWASPIQSIYPHPISWRSIIILSTHLRLVLPSGLFPSGFPTKTLCNPLSSPIRATCPAHLILLGFNKMTSTRQHNKYLLEYMDYMFRPINRSSSGLHRNKQHLRLIPMEAWWWPVNRSKHVAYIFLLHGAQSFLRS